MSGRTWSLVVTVALEQGIATVVLEERTAQQEVASATATPTTLARTLATQMAPL